MDRFKKYATPSNESYPWKTNDHALGLYSRINHRAYSGYQPTYHENIVMDGSSYRFHSPYELPFFKTKEHISEIERTTQFPVLARISYLDESLMEDSIERCVKWNIYLISFQIFFRRQCFHENEKTLQFYKIYTKNNCIQECVRNMTLKTCECVQFYMPRNNSSQLCLS